MKYYTIMAILLLVGCWNNTQYTKNSRNDNCSIYPPIIDSLQIRDVYDSARWCVYSWHCDMLYKPKNDSLQSKSFGELKLAFNKLYIRHDTIELNFTFLDKNEPVSSGMNIDYNEFLTGVSYNTITKKKINMVSPSGFSKIIKGGPNRFENSMQPEVISYIKSNRDKLDKCFRELAVEKGLLK